MALITNFNPRNSFQAFDLSPYLSTRIPPIAGQYIRSKLEVWGFCLCREDTDGVQIRTLLSIFSGEYPDTKVALTGLIYRAFVIAGAGLYTDEELESFRLDNPGQEDREDRIPQDQVW